jgi:hypothetical protein
VRNVWWSGIILQSRVDVPPAACALILGIPGLIIVSFTAMAQGLAIQLSWTSLPAAFEMPIVVLAWIGVAILTISDLLFLIVLSGALLARLRASA